MEKQTLFHEGMGEYASFRIPSLVQLPGGRIIAFCEGRVHSASDYGTIHIVARISDDGGNTFGNLRLMVSDADNTAGNPCPVYDRETGVLHLLFNGNMRDGGELKILAGQAPRTVHHMQSRDDGDTWGAPRDITALVKRKGWTWYATGPGHGIQLKSGRLLIPCNHAVLLAGQARSGPYISHAIYSDDHGLTWHPGQDVGEHTNECMLAQLPDGDVYINTRSYHGKARRAVALSSDEGESWHSLHLDDALIEPVCHGSLIAVDRCGAKETPALLFCNPASADTRHRLTLRKSLDNGLTWSSGMLLHSGPAAYSDMVSLPDGRIGVLYEAGEEHPYERIVWMKVVLK